MTYHLICKQIIYNEQIIHIIKEGGGRTRDSHLKWPHFSLSNFHLQIKSVNISTILTSKLET